MPPVRFSSNYVHISFNIHKMQKKRKKLFDTRVSGMWERSTDYELNFLTNRFEIVEYLQDTYSRGWNELPYIHDLTIHIVW